MFRRLARPWRMFAVLTGHGHSTMIMIYNDKHAAAIVARSYGGIMIRLPRVLNDERKWDEDKYHE